MTEKEFKLTKEDLERFRKENCFCDELDVDFCSKCDSPIKDQKPCIICSFLNDLIKFEEEKTK